MSRTRAVAEGTAFFLRAAAVAALAAAGMGCLAAARAIAGTTPPADQPPADLGHGAVLDQAPADQEVFLEPEYLIGEIGKVPPCLDCTTGNRLRFAVEAGQLSVRVITPHEPTCPTVRAHERATAGARIGDDLS